MILASWLLVLDIVVQVSGPNVKPWTSSPNPTCEADAWSGHAAMLYLGVIGLDNRDFLWTLPDGSHQRHRIITWNPAGNGCISVLATDGAQGSIEIAQPAGGAR